MIITIYSYEMPRINGYWLEFWMFHIFIIIFDELQILNEFRKSIACHKKQHIQGNVVELHQGSSNKMNLYG